MSVPACQENMHVAILVSFSKFHRQMRVQTVDPLQQSLGTSTGTLLDVDMPSKVNQIAPLDVQVADAQDQLKAAQDSNKDLKSQLRGAQEQVETLVTQHEQSVKAAHKETTPCLPRSRS